MFYYFIYFFLLFHCCILFLYFFVLFFILLFLFIFYLFLYLLLIFKPFLEVPMFYIYCYSLRNIHQNPNKTSKINIIMINMAHFLNMSLFYFKVKCDIILATISNVIVTVVFYNLVETELCYTYL